MTARSKNRGPGYKGHDSNIHVTVNAEQRAKVVRNARLAKLSISVYMRRVIDGLEVA